MRYITRENVKQISGYEPTGGMMYILHQRFCRPMSWRGRCVYPKCESCQVYLKRAFDLGGSRNREAVLTYRVREVIASIDEEPRQEPQTSDANAFVAFLEQL